MRSLLCMALGGMAAAAGAQSSTATSATSAAAPTVEVRPSASTPATPGDADAFTGVARISSPFQARPPGNAGGAIVTFEPAARTAWHSHPLGQTLVVTAGTGLVQQQGQRAQVIRVGDVVTIPAHTRHWHGAGPDGPMTHVAVAEKEDGVSVTWYAKVADAEYRAAVDSAAFGQHKPGVARAVPSRSDTLSARQRAIPLIGAFMASSDMPRLHTALGQGLDAGMTVSEAKEVLVQLYAYAGFPRSLNALAELMKVVDAREARGVHDAPGRDIDKAVPTGEDLLAAGRANQTEISGGPVRGSMFDFAPVINRFLQSHLFGDIFERDILDWQSRELATVGALAATPGAQAQLRSHMQASLRVGLSAAQLQQVTDALGEEAGGDVAHRAREALSQVLTPASKGGT